MFISFLSIIFVLFFHVNSLTEKMADSPIKSRLLLASSSRWYGGTHGNGPYTLEASDSNAYITKICVHHVQGMIIGSIQAYFSNGESSQRYGGTNVVQECYSVNNGQCISKVSVTYCVPYKNDDLGETWYFINSLQFESSDGSKSSLYGRDGCWSYTYTSSGYGCLKSISVKSDTMIDAIQFHWL